MLLNASEKAKLKGKLRLKKTQRLATKQEALLVASELQQQQKELHETSDVDKNDNDVDNGSIKKVSPSLPTQQNDSKSKRTFVEISHTISETKNKTDELENENQSKRPRIGLLFFKKKNKTIFLFIISSFEI